MKKLIALIMFILLLVSIPGICGAVRSYKEDAKLYTEYLSDYLAEQTQ